MITLLQVYEDWDGYLDCYFGFMENFGLSYDEVMKIPIKFRDEMIKRKNEVIEKQNARARGKFFKL